MPLAALAQRWMKMIEERHDRTTWEGNNLHLNRVAFPFPVPNPTPAGKTFASFQMLANSPKYSWSSL